jgi:hypothetical protein
MSDPAIAACRLDRDGLRRQGVRYRRLAADVEAIDRGPGWVAVRFHSGFDEGLLREAIGVERECCPFFGFDYSQPDRRLRVTVAAGDRLAALDALAEALGASRHPRRARG